jgi:hypothetical protein
MFLVYRLFKPLLILVLYILVVFVGIESVSAKTKNIKVSVSYKPKAYKQLNIKKFKLNHPIKISKREIINHLVSLRYRATAIGNKEESIFFPEEIQKLAPILAKVFVGVDPKKVVHVELKSKRGSTVADIFSFRNYLNWRFESIHGETFFQKNDARGWNIYAWELIPQKGQLYYKSSENKRLHKNWMVAKLHLPNFETKGGANRKPSGFIEKDNPDKTMNEELERKLRQLKNLYDQELIAEEEYKIQQKNLFEQLF